MDILKVGDIVVYKTRWNTSFVTITRETKTMFIGDKSVRIYKKNNCIVGEGYTSVRLATQEDFDNKEKSRLAYGLRGFNFDRLSLNTLREIRLLTCSCL